MYYINTKVETNARRYFEPEQKQWYKIDDIMNHHKKQAQYTTYKSTDLSKDSYIGKVCEDFVLDILENIYPKPKLYEKWKNKEQNIELTMVLDSMPEVGSIIGAACYRLAEQLDAELADNGIEDNLSQVGVRPQWGGIDIEDDRNCYQKYFLRDENAIYEHADYFVGSLRGHKYNKVTSAIAHEFDNLGKLSPSYRKEVYRGLKMLFHGEPIKEFVGFMYRDSKDHFYKQYSCRAGVPSKEQQGPFADAVARIRYCEKISNLLEEADAADKAKEDSEKDDKANNDDNNKEIPVANGDAQIDW